MKAYERKSLEFLVNEWYPEQLKNPALPPEIVELYYAAATKHAADLAAENTVELVLLPDPVTRTLEPIAA